MRNYAWINFENEHDYELEKAQRSKEREEEKSFQFCYKEEDQKVESK